MISFQYSWMVKISFRIFFFIYYCISPLSFALCNGKIHSRVWYVIMAQRRWHKEGLLSFASIQVTESRHRNSSQDVLQRFIISAVKGIWLPPPNLLRFSLGLYHHSSWHPPSPKFPLQQAGSLLSLQQYSKLCTHQKMRKMCPLRSLNVAVREPRNPSLCLGLRGKIHHPSPEKGEIYEEKALRGPRPCFSST